MRRRQGRYRESARRRKCLYCVVRLDEVPIIAGCTRLHSTTLNRTRTALGMPRPARGMRDGKPRNKWRDPARHMTRPATSEIFSQRFELIKLVVCFYNFSWMRVP